MRTLRFLLPALLPMLLWGNATAQQAEPAELSLARLYSSPDFFGDRFGPVRWLEDGSGYTTLEDAPDVEGGTDIVRYTPGTGARDVLLSAAQLIPEGAEAPIAVQNYDWSADGKKVLLYTNSKRVWRQNTRGDYWVLDRETGHLHQLGGDGPASTLMFAKFSPDGTRVGYVRRNNIFVEDLADGTITPLTHDGSETIINGTFDWVYEEEFSLRDGFRWSADGQKIAYWQLDAEGVGQFLMINNTDSLYSFTIPLQYPKTGTTNSSSRIGVIDLGTRRTVWVQDTDNPREHYLARMEWAGDTNELIIQHLNRLQNTNTVLLADAQTGQTRTVMTDRDDAWLDVVDDVIWMDNDQTFTWVSEQDGWRHVYLVDRKTGTLKRITDGAYDVMSIERIDVAGGWIYFIGSFDAPTQRYLYRVPLRGGAAERLTPEDLPGWHSYQVSEDAKWAIHNYSTFNTPTTIDLVSLPDHKVVKSFVDNARLKAAVAELPLGETEFLRVEIEDSVALDGWMIKPSHFDPSKKYPVLFYVYGEPAGQTVVDRWGGHTKLWHHLIAEQGYLVISIDNRGTPAPRGRDWRKSIYGEIGTLAAQDQAAALKQIAKWPYVDDSRIGIWGWSGGGSMTLNMLFRYPELYHTGMSVAPVPNQRYYDTIYQERYMGLPQDNAEGYEKGSPVTYAENLQGNLLLVHGTGDDNVHYQGTEELINKLISLNKPFTMMAYPNRSHGIFEGSGTSRHLRELLTRYLLDNLPPGGRAPDASM